MERFMMSNFKVNLKLVFIILLILLTILKKTAGISIQQNVAKTLRDNLATSLGDENGSKPVRESSLNDRFTVQNMDTSILNSTSGSQLPTQDTGGIDCIPYDWNCYKCPHTYVIHHQITFYNKTVCYSRHNSTNVDTLLQNISIDTKALEIVVDNTWGGYYPLTPEPIDIRNLTRLVNLEMFQLTQGYFEFLQPYPLRYDEDTFRSLTKLKILKINLPLQNQPLKAMIEPLFALETLNISSTRGLSMEHVYEIMRVINNQSIIRICMDTFQLIGGPGYEGYLNFSKFFSDRTFTHLEELSLSGNSLIRIYPGITQAAPNLKKFDISWNILLDSVNVPALVEASMHPNITFLYMGYQGYVGGGLNKIPLAINERPKTKHHGMDTHNEVTTYNLASSLEAEQRTSYQSIINFKHPQFQRIVDCLNNNDKDANNTSNITLLLENKTTFYKTLQCLLPRQFDTFPVSPDILPDVERLINTSCMLLVNLPFGKKLQEIYFSHVQWEKSVTLGVKLKGNLCFMPNNITSVVFTHNSGWLASAKLADILNNTEYIHGLNNLRTLDLSHNNLTFDIGLFRRGMYFPNLNNLNIAGNNISMSNDFIFCEYLPHLKYIDISENKLNLEGYFKISRNVAANCMELEELNLSKNNLTSFLHLNFSGTTHLRKIDLSYNHMNFLDKPLLDSLEVIPKQTNHTLEIDLTGNPLLCGCSTVYFLDWVVKMKDSGAVIFTNIESFICDSGDQKQLISFSNLTVNGLKDLDHDCHPSLLPLIMGSVWGTIAAVLVVLLCGGIYLYRWRIRYKLFRMQVAFKRCFPKSNEDEEEKSFKYDAFVSYVAEDRFWVHDVLMKTLEQQYSFRLCIHYRDFPVGEPIPITVTKNMNNSREIIVVISDMALKSTWCDYELNQALLLTGQRKKRLIVIKLGELKNKMDNETAANILDTHTYLEWADNPKAGKLFWAKLVGKMYGDVDGNCACCCRYGAKAIKYNQLHDANDVSYGTF